MHLSSSLVVERTLPRFNGEVDHEGIRWAFTLRHATVGWDVEARRTEEHDASEAPAALHRETAY